MDGREVIKAGLARAEECQREMTSLATAAKEQLLKMKRKEKRCRLFQLRWARERLLRGSAVPGCLLIAPLRGNHTVTPARMSQEVERSSPTSNLIHPIHCCSVSSVRSIRKLEDIARVCHPHTRVGVVRNLGSSAL